jgi:formimidoylglutamate deiminase
MASFLFDRALLPTGWAQEVCVIVDASGDVSAVTGAAEAPADAVRLAGVAIPGMPNLHSHAFQRALSGLAELRGSADDSFWSWRETMYRLVDRISPEQLQAVAAGLYLEMLKAGYTGVAEFHYLHQDPAGRPYDNPATLSLAVIEAARRAGIALTLLPVYYRVAGFDASAAEPRQRRFLHRDPERFLALTQRLRRASEGDPQLTVGIAPHSLRAVPPDDLALLLAQAASGPVHLHVAEQQREVSECLAHRGVRPVQWLFEHCEPDRRWCLVHATHLEEGERRAIAASGAVAGLCPTTEANLGDGLFPLAEYLADGGSFGIGSDSNASVSPIEELRWLEYGQRLRLLRRNIAAGGGSEHVGESLWRRACAGGAQALGRRCGAIAAGARADIAVLDPDHPALLGRREGYLLDSLVFAGNGNPVSDVICGGRHVVAAGRHVAQEAIEADFRAALLALAA